MWKKGETAEMAGDSGSTRAVEKRRSFQLLSQAAELSTEMFSFSTEICGKKENRSTRQCRDVMLVFSSLTRSAKAGSFFIFCSTWRME